MKNLPLIIIYKMQKIVGLKPLLSFFHFKTIGVKLPPSSDCLINFVNLFLMIVDGPFNFSFLRNMVQVELIIIIG